MILAKSLIFAITVSNKSHVIAGSTKKLGQPVSDCDVRIFNRATGALLNTVRSDANGEYKAYVPYSLAYTVVAFDRNKKFNAVIQDNVVPK